jgi:RimJ/RimL family protein N-acetyltransferase
VESVIREASMDDAEELRRYACTLFAEELPGLYRRPDPTIEQERVFIASYLHPANSTLLVAEADGLIVGILGLEGRTLAQDAHNGSIGISVARDYRGRGVGTRLIGRVLEWAPLHGVRRVEVEAFANNPDAIRLYERLGFEPEGVRRDAVEVDGRFVDVVFLAKRITI